MPTSTKHGWPFWFAAVVIALPSLYLASFGPACRAAVQFELAERQFYAVYRPMESVLKVLPRPMAESLVWYAELWMPFGAVIVPPYEDDDGEMWVGYGVGCFLPPME